MIILSRFCGPIEDFQSVKFSGPAVQVFQMAGAGRLWVVGFVVNKLGGLCGNFLC